LRFILSHFDLVSTMLIINSANDLHAASGLLQRQSQQLPRCLHRVPSVQTLTCHLIISSRPELIEKSYFRGRGRSGIATRETICR